MRYILLIAPALLAGCAHNEPAVQVRTVETVVTRVEKCVDEKDIPTKPKGLGKRPSSNARVLADILLAKVRSWENYGDKADPVMRGCASK